MMMTIIRIMTMLFINQKDHCLGTLIIVIDLLYQVSNHDFTMHFRFFESIIHFCPNMLENDTYFLLTAKCRVYSDCPVGKTCIDGICKGNYFSYFQLELRSYKAKLIKSMNKV